ncbi:MAG: hypothetical protein J5505_05780 [Spirochaetaceae bacterium]|nr:hypothetical protein [Spirochaetaceae bacterium]
MKTAKKLCLCGAAIFFGFTLFAQNNSTDLTPLAGIWENSNRIISVNEDNSLQFVLKTFYGFYYDKAAVLNASLDSGENGETILRIKYPSERKPQAHPIGVINNKLFLDFYCRSYIEDDEAENYSYVDKETDESHNSPLYGYWRCCGNVNGIEIAVPSTKPELTCYYFTDSEVYFLRYWQADVPYERETVDVNDGDFSFKVDKLLKVGDIVYTCVVGRGTFVRNFEKTTYKIDGDTVNFGTASEKYPLYRSQDGSLLAFSEPYIVRSEIADLEAAIAEHNSHTHNPLKNPMEVFNRKTAWEEKLEKMTIN